MTRAIDQLQTALGELLLAAWTDGTPTGPIRQVTADSRRVSSGSLFVAVVGETVDGHRFIPAAVANGAAAVVGQYGPAQLADQGIPFPLPVPYWQVSDSGLALAGLAAAWHGHPSRQLQVIGVTGTDGKTTTCTLLESILTAATRTQTQAAGAVGVITTVGARVRGVESDTGFHVTTPSAPEVQAFLAQMVSEGCQYAVVESTSHGLAQHRVAAVAFDVAAVTNITHEHLDYHRSFDAYLAAKGRLFQSLFREERQAHGPRFAVLNGDDELSFPRLQALLRREATHPSSEVRTLVYSMDPTRRAAQVRALQVAASPQGTRLLVRAEAESLTLESALIGDFNVYNILCAVTVATALGIAPGYIQEGVRTMAGVPGRMERVDRGQDFLAVVDFAHSPASLERALQTLRTWVLPGPDDRPGRLIAVFGSAGLRDRAKRRLMGEVSGRLADFTVITAEDPRTESLAEINREIELGVTNFVDERHYWVEPDRNRAIQFAVDMARPGDVVAAFGKGHEQSMCFGEIEYPWSDRQALINALDRRYGRPVAAEDERLLPTARAE